MRRHHVVRPTLTRRVLPPARKQRSRLDQTDRAVDERERGQLLAVQRDRHDARQLRSVDVAQDDLDPLVLREPSKFFKRRYRAAVDADDAVRFAKRRVREHGCRGCGSFERVRRVRVRRARGVDRVRDRERPARVGDPHVRQRARPAQRQARRRAHRSHLSAVRHLGEALARGRARARGAVGDGDGGAGGEAYQNGGSGGSGVVILRYPDVYTTAKTNTLISSVSTSVAGYKIETFTSGTGTITFA